MPSAWPEPFASSSASLKACRNSPPTLPAILRRHSVRETALAPYPSYPHCRSLRRPVDPVQPAVRPGLAGLAGSGPVLLGSDLRNFHPTTPGPHHLTVASCPWRLALCS